MIWLRSNINKHFLMEWFTVILKQLSNQYTIKAECFPDMSFNEATTTISVKNNHVYGQLLIFKWIQTKNPQIISLIIFFIQFFTIIRMYVGMYITWCVCDKVCRTCMLGRKKCFIDRSPADGWHCGWVTRTEWNTLRWSVRR